MLALRYLNSVRPECPPCKWEVRSSNLLGTSKLTDSPESGRLLQVAEAKISVTQFTENKTHTLFTKYSAINNLIEKNRSERALVTLSIPKRCWSPILLGLLVGWLPWLSLDSAYTLFLYSSVDQWKITNLLSWQGNPRMQVRVLSELLCPL